MNQMQSNARAGLEIDESGYESIRERHNSTVGLYNSELSLCRSLADEHDPLVDTTESALLANDMATLSKLLRRWRRNGQS